MLIFWFSRLSCWDNMLNKSNKHGEGRLIAVRRFDEELYRLVKMYASLEGRRIASILEEAVEMWLESRGGVEEARLWARLEEEYERNLRVLEGVKAREGYALVCGGRLVGVFQSYTEAAAKSREECVAEAIIARLPYKAGERRVELGLPW